MTYSDWIIELFFNDFRLNEKVHYDVKVNHNASLSDHLTNLIAALLANQ